MENIERQKYYVCKKTGLMCNISSYVWELGEARVIANDSCFIKSYENSDTENRINDFCKHLGEEYNG